jgi:dolichyl-phosphate beta-glucosyltransferase
MRMKYQDTQCGFKLFNKRAAEDIFERVQCTSLAFDVEVLYLAEQLEYTVAEIPVIWDNDNDSRVRLVRDSWSMLRDLVNIRRRVTLSETKGLALTRGDSSLRSE